MRIFNSAYTPPNAPPASATGFWSIERAVAFVVGPAVTAGAGWLSTLLAKKWGIHVEGPELVGLTGTGALTAGGLVYKWLHGRQLEMSLHASALAPIVGSEPVEGFLKTTVADLEGLAQAAASKAVKQITGQPVAATVDDPSPPIAAAVGDPAPTTAAEGAATGQ